MHLNWERCTPDEERFLLQLTIRASGSQAVDVNATSHQCGIYQRVLKHIDAYFFLLRISQEFSLERLCCSSSSKVWKWGRHKPPVLSRGSDSKSEFIKGNVNNCLYVGWNDCENMQYLCRITIQYTVCGWELYSNTIVSLMNINYFQCLSLCPGFLCFVEHSYRDPESSLAFASCTPFSCSAFYNLHAPLLFCEVLFITAMAKSGVWLTSGLHL